MFLQLVSLRSSSFGIEFKNDLQFSQIPWGKFYKKILNKDYS